MPSALGVLPFLQVLILHVASATHSNVSASASVLEHATAVPHSPFAHVSIPTVEPVAHRLASLRQTPTSVADLHDLSVYSFVVDSPVSKHVVTLTFLTPSTMISSHLGSHVAGAAATHVFEPTSHLGVAPEQSASALHLPSFNAHLPSLTS